VTVTAEVKQDVLDQVARLVKEVKAAQADPAEFLRHTKAIDPKTGEEFYFHFDKGWEWQREELSSYRDSQMVVRLKARQLGVSWLGIGYCLWKCLMLPGTRTLCVSINEVEAQKLVNRAWDLWESLPKHLRMDAKVIKPTKHRPSTRIEWEFPGGEVSALIAMPSTPKAGHGETAAVAFLDEFARHQYAGESWKAFVPTIADGGQIIVVSTANGYGNEYYNLWMSAEERDIDARFLGADFHPGRDKAWFERMRKRLSPADMAEQYPLNAAEAFLGTSGCWFDVDALGRYAEKLRETEYRFNFIPDESGAKAVMAKRSDGWIGVYDKPDKTREYAVYADVATGRGLDFTAAYVIDLSNMNIVCEMHGKIDPDLTAEQLHFLGRWYNTARLAVEMGGGYGEAVVIPLRDGKRGRRPYPKLYRHVQDDRPDYKQNITYGFPVTSKTRPLLVSGLERAIREQSIPHIPMQAILECKTFVRHDTLPSPRAADGTHDDRVMALAGALEMFRRYGDHPLDMRRSRRREKRGYVPEYAWT
jgi:Terminase large subunit, T4likevirus-type, N-terminal